ncbi:MAG: RluA family pseudouridine synthase [Bacteroidales bacterium]|nr:RluA family pseudouridine synthase [Bacteroidales bacterium]
MEYRTLSDFEINDIQSRILYEDNHILILNKRVGEIVQGDKTGDEPLVETIKAFIALRDGKPGKVFLGVPHRLDRPVSGAVMFAKTGKALERLNDMLRAGSVHKTYWALVCNEPVPAEGELEDWLYRIEKQNKSYICRLSSSKGNYAQTASQPETSAKNSQSGPPRPDAKIARLRYRLLEETDKYWLVEVELLTGRHHQIRCQLSGMGCPIKGDLKYGAPRSNPDSGISLHARSISFIHPVRKKEITVTAPYPSSWKGIHIA